MRSNTPVKGRGEVPVIAPSADADASAYAKKQKLKYREEFLKLFREVAAIKEKATV